MGFSTNLLTDLNYNHEEIDLYKLFMGLANGFMKKAEANNEDPKGIPSVYVLTISCHGLACNGQTYAVVPCKMEDKMGFRYISIEKLAT